MYTIAPIKMTIKTAVVVINIMLVLLVETCPLLSIKMFDDLLK